jgi:hypothetical protein
VLDEIRAGETAMAEQRLESIRDVPLLTSSNVSRNFADQIVRIGILPTKANRDAAHIALATIQRMDILLTWNCRHLANASIQERLRRFSEKMDLRLPTICTPEELMNYGNDQDSGF